jgi:hypothetical protein
MRTDGDDTPGNLKLRNKKTPAAKLPYKYFFGDYWCCLSYPPMQYRILSIPAGIVKVDIRFLYCCRPIERHCILFLSFYRFSYAGLLSAESKHSVWL